MQSYLGSYGRIPECVPDEFMPADRELPDDNVMRSPLIIKLVRKLCERCDGNPLEAFDELSRARDYPTIIRPSKFY